MSLSPKALCEALLKLDREEDVISLLRSQGLWDEPSVWRHYGDVENNWGQSGNQQSLAEAALAEKVVNSVDATLIGKCLESGIDPQSAEAPQSIRAAVSRFYDVGTDKLATGGRVMDWTPEKRRQVAETIALIATGSKDAIAITVSDMGEGQTPDRVPDTILSLNKSNKMRVPFVQGQFNQGGTGALRFAGRHNLQLVITRRNPKFLISGATERDSEWSFTIVRRERPSQTHSRNSIYTYLAPLGVQDSRDGSILSFAADALGLFPDAGSPYGRMATHGTAVKLYEYNFMGERSNILRGRSLFTRLDLLLPQIALPIRVYEMRPRANGKLLPPGSRETTLDGLVRRLNESSNLEAGFPVSVPFSPMGEKLTAIIYAGRRTGSLADEDDDLDESASRRKVGGLKRYRRREGVIFVRNGQTQGTLPKEFFQRPGAKMKPLADDLLLFVDCDVLSPDTREDLFMASRDRLVDGPFKLALVTELEAALANCEELKELRNRRQQQELEDRLKDDKPLTDVLASLIDSSPNLRQLLRLGTRIPSPLKLVANETDSLKLPKLKAFPSFFSLRGYSTGSPLQRTCPVNQRSRFTFDTDVQDGYFVRRDERERGSFDCIAEGGTPISLSGPNLKSGVATITVSLPENAEPGDVLRLRFETRDPFNTFVNEVHISIVEAAEKREAPTGKPREPGERKKGQGGKGPSTLSPPDIQKVYREDWDQHGFTERTALEVKTIGYEEDGGEIRRFLVNMDNGALLHEAAQKRLPIELARNQFLYGNVLVGLAMLVDDEQRPAPSSDEPSSESISTIEQSISGVTRALAPFLLAIASLGASDLGQALEVDGLEEAA
jgi:hypothetical protein